MKNVGGHHPRTNAGCPAHRYFLCKENIMMEDKTITVTCPKCGVKMTNTASWFKKPGNCCSGCQLRFSTERFKRAIEAAENLV
jgi:peptide subunit release factor 1 (eRF1)